MTSPLPGVLYVGHIGLLLDVDGGTCPAIYLVIETQSALTLPETCKGKFVAVALNFKVGIGESFISIISLYDFRIFVERNAVIRYGDALYFR